MIFRILKTHVNHKDAIAAAEAKPLWGGFCSGPISELKAKKRGTARYKGWYLTVSNPLIFMANLCPLRRAEVGTFPIKSEKTAPVRELRVPAPLKNAIFRRHQKAPAKRVLAPRHRSMKTLPSGKLNASTFDLNGGR